MNYTTEYSRLGYGSKTSSYPPENEGNGSTDTSGKFEVIQQATHREV
jgi:hypothetical protein